MFETIGTTSGHNFYMGALNELKLERCYSGILSVSRYDQICSLTIEAICDPPWEN